MKQLILAILLFSLFSLFTSQLYGVNAIPYPVIQTMPDGSNLSVLIKGNEFFHYKTNSEGYLIKKDEKGFYQYAILNQNGEQILTGVRVNEIGKQNEFELNFKSTLSKSDITDLMIVQQKNQKVKSLESEQNNTLINFPKTGSPKSLVILVNFKDVKFTVNNPLTSFHNMLNQSGFSDNGATGSARDYFIASSNEQFLPNFDVVGPYDLTNNVSFYGANGTDGNDKNPRQMIIDACNAANFDVDFSKYDENADGIVDNVFVYYAGYNEAENGPDNTIWPHKWALSSLTLDKIKISGYACTSELNGNSGSTQCGIGTFCHEFSHIIGLADYSATDGGSHHTLSYWNIMDAGSYLNNGKTPPTYSAFDRYFLGWLSPTKVINTPDMELKPITDSNNAYILYISESTNLYENNPIQTEFFMFENRQKKGWDSYLPGHGLLITRIKYDQNKWYSNTVNNVSTSMNVDILEADKIPSSGSLTGDLYPGTNNIKTFTPILMDGTTIPVTFSEITELGEIIKINRTVTNFGPISLGLSNNTINENSSFHTFVGKLSTIDFEQNDSFNYTFVSGIGSIDNSDFMISNDSLFSNTQFDFETKKLYNIRVKTTDLKGLFKEQDLLINVNNLFDEIPYSLNLSKSTIPEMQSIGSTIGYLSTLDSDLNDAFNYSLVDDNETSDNVLFQLTSNALTLNTLTNYEIKNKYQIKVRTTDKGGLILDNYFTINITDVNEAPKAINLNYLFKENLINKGSTICEINTLDEDLNDTFKYELVIGNGSFDNNLFGILDNNKLIALQNIDLTNDNNKYFFRLQSTDKGGLNYSNYFTLTNQDIYNNIFENDDNNIIIYPNPISNYFKIFGLTDSNQITITDLTGKKIIDQVILPEEIIYMNNLSTGFYLLTFRQNNKNFVFKLNKI